MNNETNIPLTGIELVRAERERQITTEGYSASHDDGHWPGELTKAGCSYALSAAAWMVRKDSERGPLLMMASQLWPWKSIEFRGGSRRRLLVKAAALLVAEIERDIRSEQEAV